MLLCTRRMSAPTGGTLRIPSGMDSHHRFYRLEKQLSPPRELMPAALEEGRAWTRAWWYICRFALRTRNRLGRLSWVFVK